MDIDYLEENDNQYRRNMVGDVGLSTAKMEVTQAYKFGEDAAAEPKDLDDRGFRF